jgi:hypothetical protein
MKLKAKAPLLLGAKTPQCEADGSFKQVQSWEGYQWCVDENGIELVGTRVGRGKPSPDCSKGLLNFNTYSRVHLEFNLLCNPNPATELKLPREGENVSS